MGSVSPGWLLPKPPVTWPLFLGASGTAKSPHGHPTWEACHGTLALLGRLEAFCGTQGWPPTLSGLWLWSGRGSKRPCPQRARKVVCGGAVRLDRLPAPGPGCRPPGARDEESPHQACGESLACPRLTGSRAGLCPPQTAGPGSWTSPRGSFEDTGLPDCGEKAVQPQGGTSGSGTDSTGQSLAGPLRGHGSRLPGWLYAHRFPTPPPRRAICRGAGISEGEGPGGICTPPMSPGPSPEAARLPSPTPAAWHRLLPPQTGPFQGQDPGDYSQNLHGSNQGSRCRGCGHPARFPAPGQGRRVKARPARGPPAVYAPPLPALPARRLEPRWPQEPPRAARPMPSSWCGFSVCGLWGTYRVGPPATFSCCTRTRSKCCLFFLPEAKPLLYFLELLIVNLRVLREKPNIFLL